MGKMSVFKDDLCSVTHSIFQPPATSETEEDAAFPEESPCAKIKSQYVRDKL